MNETEFLSKYWNYYLTLEEKVINLQKYIEFEPENEQTFSNEIMSIYISVCCEIDVLFKVISDSPNSSTIAYYKDFISKDNFYSQLILESTSLLYWGKMTYQPFFALSSEKNSSPEWWKSYNEVKHSRIMDNNYQKANIKNLFMSLSALYLLEIYFYKNTFAKTSGYNIPTKKSNLFEAGSLKADFLEANEINCQILEEWN